MKQILIIAFRKLLLDTEMLTIEGWAIHLLVTTDVIEEWLDGSRIPTQDHVFKIISYLSRFQDPKAEKALEEFYEVAELPIREVIGSGFMYQFGKITTFMDYILSVVFPTNLKFELSQSPSKYRQQLLGLCITMVKASNEIIEETGSMLHPKKFAIERSKIKEFLKEQMK